MFKNIHDVFKNEDLIGKSNPIIQNKLMIIKEILWEKIINPYKKMEKLISPQ
jgi:hypothetical protein